MTRPLRIATAAAALSLAAITARAQPQVDLPDAQSAPPPAAPLPPATPPPAVPPAGAPAVGLPPSPPPENSAPIQERLTSGEEPVATTTIGGYGQLDLKYVRRGFGNDFDGRGNVRRIVLLVGHQWTPAIRSYVELEWENAVACGAGCQGVAEVEQAFVDADLLGPRLRLRAGLILVPMGIVNRWHEPPVFFGVDRPSFDQAIIPSTWRELAVGFVGRLGDRWRGEVYLMNALDPTRLGPDGILGGRGSGSFARTRAGALVGRLEFEPFLGSMVGLAGYASNMANNGKFYDADGRPRALNLPVFGWALDARARKWGLEVRLVAAQFFLPRSGALLDTRDDTGRLYYPDPQVAGAVPNRTEGGYLEIAYDVLRPLLPGTGHQLLPFVRLEHYNTQAAVPFPFRPRGEFDVNELTVGVNYLPIRQLVVKGDVQLRDRRYGLDELWIDFGLGWMF